MKIFKTLLVFITFAFVNTVVAQAVYTTKTGEKYHTSSCRYLKVSKKEYTLEKAKAFGFTACLVCKPNNLNSKPNSKVKSQAIAPISRTKTPSKTSTATQCKGTTKAGNRCKRMTKSGNGRCHQH